MNNSEIINTNLSFIKDELRIIQDKYNALLYSTCGSLIAHEKLFRAKLKTINSNGTAVLIFRDDSPIPRMNSGEQHFIFLKKEDRSKDKCQKIRYRDLLNLRVSKSVIKGKLIWFRPYKSSQKDNLLQEIKCREAGFSLTEYTTESIQDLQARKFEGAIIYLGECEPLLDMLNNLLNYIRSHPGNPLFINQQKAETPQVKPLINPEPNNIIRLSELHRSFIIQGPPGSGKSYIIANLAKTLALQNKSVLITTLANKALIEIIKKDPLADLLKQGRLFKKALDREEESECRGIQNLKDVVPKIGEIHFSTYYSASGSPLLKHEGSAYDYVIVDEASQAVTAFLAATYSIGDKQIFVGDICQLPPVVQLDSDRIEKRNYHEAVYGLQKLSKLLPTYQLVNTYRLNPNSASYTRLFYTLNLMAVNDNYHLFPLNILNNQITFESGTYLLRVSSVSIINAISDICCQLNEFKPTHDQRIKARIAVMTNLVKDVNRVFKKLNESIHSITDRFTVDTVHRCQGFTSDFAIYYVSESEIYAWKPEIFNVATSRAKIATFIICSNYIKAINTVPFFINKLNQEGHILNFYDTINGELHNDK